MADFTRKIWDVATKLGTIAAVAACTTVIAHEITQRTHDLRIAAIEGSRFTGEDGLKLEKTIKEWVAANYPPADLREDMREVKAKLDAIDERLRQHQIDHGGD